MADWRRPLTILHHEPSDQANMINGRLVRAERVVYDRESTERIRQGYACANCMEPFEQAWPERCPVCRVPVRARQAEFVARELDAQVMKLGPSTSLADEFERMHEEIAREEREKK